MLRIACTTTDRRRELHIEKGLAVANTGPYDGEGSSRSSAITSSTELLEIDHVHAMPYRV